tara:strand:+ start:250 stop:672 length:423 start_codon:yes stop_codon:yes gene_type:complete
MRYFALINPDNTVVQVNPIEDKHLLNSDGQYTESKGIEYLQKFYKQYDYSSGFRWLETKKDDSIRNTFAGIGMIYINESDCFISLKPYSSWYLRQSDDGHYYWSPPTDPPDDDNFYYWDEDLFQSDTEVANAGWILSTEE